MPDGKTYFAPKDHLTLANWLNATGVDIKGAVRLEATKHAYGKSSFDVTSLYNYKFSESSNMDEQIALTDKQGEALAKVYGGLQSAWENLANFEEVLYMSTGFGLGKKDEKYDANIAKNNLKILRNYVDEDYFDVKAYKQTMSSGSDPHSPLS